MPWPPREACRRDAEFPRVRVYPYTGRRKRRLYTPGAVEASNGFTRTQSPQPAHKQAGGTSPLPRTPTSSRRRRRTKPARVPRGYETPDAPTWRGADGRRDVRRPRPGAKPPHLRGKVDGYGRFLARLTVMALFSPGSGCIFDLAFNIKPGRKKTGTTAKGKNRAITVSLGIFAPQPSALPFINATAAVFATRHIANVSLATRHAITRQPRHPARRSSRACRPICHSGQAGQMARHGDQACRRHIANGSLRFSAAYPFGTEVPGGSGKGAPHSLQWVSPSSFCAPQDRHVPMG